MEPGLFEGYIGIRLWDGQLISDVVFSLMFFLLFLFALLFRANRHYFAQMLGDLFSVKDRKSLFEDSVADDFQIRTFLVFQALFLCCIILFSGVYAYGKISIPSVKAVCVLLLLLFCVFFAFYQFKQAMNYILGWVFADAEKYRLWKTHYNVIMGFWGIFLYLPALWIVFFGELIIVPVIMFLFFYISCRILLIYKTLRIFYIKNSGLLYLSLYLCAQEILPIVFLYEGLIYLYNIIETSTLWH
ncbi:DUF4271 domain-containing protein [Parabacteroides sp. Marseille-P3160]|uniref:DUF4271 domain-containing protein n=1 Tax=Parabacteroides sp. Marseille-P3160 TaxID=1917887 RepID=UPI001F41FA50|nr:DUF4271 domain-containing protein [Parabacteroides sp. Marseille-P3160]